MRNLWLVPLLGFCSELAAQSNCVNPINAFPVFPMPFQQQVVSILDFGAVPNDGCSDQYAFEAASAFIQMKQGYTKLTIPAGEYIVSRQVPGGNGNYYQGIPVIDLSGCVDVLIHGEVDPGSGLPLSVLRYDECLYYSTFDPVTGSRWLHSGVAIPQDHVAHVGTCINLVNCVDVDVRNLYLDGNSDRYIIGGYSEAGGDGLSLMSCHSVSITNVHAWGFARDGMTINAQVPSPTEYFDLDLRISGSSANWNGRAGITWLGGSYLAMENTNAEYIAIGYYASANCSGLHIEMEGAPITNGVFTGCKFRFNRNFSVISDVLNSYYRVYYTGDLQFNRCVIAGSEGGSGFYLDVPRTRLTRCDIYGSNTHLFGRHASVTPPPPASFGTVLEECEFRETLNGLTMGVYGARLLDSGPEGAFGAQLINTTFKTDGNMLGPWMQGVANTCDGQILLHDFVYENVGCAGGVGLSTSTIANARTPTAPIRIHPSVLPSQQWIWAGVPCPGNVAVVDVPTTTPLGACPAHYTNPVYNILSMLPTCGAPCVELAPALTCRDVQEQLPYPDLLPPQGGKNLAVAQATDLALFPNPASDEVVVSLGDLEGSSGVLVLSDMLGNDVARIAVQGGPQCVIDVSGLATGTYVLQYVNNGRVTSTRKLFIAR